MEIIKNPAAQGSTGGPLQVRVGKMRMASAPFMIHPNGRRLTVSQMFFIFGQNVTPDVFYFWPKLCQREGGC